jgi:septal ring factor EnvC (AmiA/AmiB activator)
MRLSRQQLADNEAKIRAAMSRLLNGDIPPGGKCDIKTLALAAGIDRTAFYGSRPYARLREEFEQRLQEITQAGEQPDPRDAQVARLKDEITRLKESLAQSAVTVTDLTDFRDQALARLAAQHDEIARLRHDLQLAATIRRLPAPPAAPPVKEPALP